MQHSGLMKFPGAGKFIRISHANLIAFVMRKIEIVFPQGFFNPVRNPNQTGTVQINITVCSKILDKSSIEFFIDNRILR